MQDPLQTLFPAGDIPDFPTFFLRGYGELMVGSGNDDLTCRLQIADHRLEMICQGYELPGDFR